jgi:hypothetical protein
MKIKFLLSVVFFTLFFTACKNKKIVEVENIVKEWKGREIQFPENLQCTILGKDTIPDICTASFQKNYKILLYVDSI